MSYFMSLYDLNCIVYHLCIYFHVSLVYQMHWYVVSFSVVSCLESISWLPLRVSITFISIYLKKKGGLSLWNYFNHSTCYWSICTELGMWAVMYLPLSTILQLDIGTVLSVWYLFVFHFISYKLSNEDIYLFSCIFYVKTIGQFIMGKSSSLVSANAINISEN